MDSDEHVSLDDRMQSVWLDSGYSDMGKIVVEELEFQGLPTFLGPAGIFAGKISAGQNLVEYYPVEAASEIGDRHMYVVHGNQDKRVRLHHGEEMCEIALENGKEGNVECWFEDSVIRYDVGKGMDSDEHVSLDDRMQSVWLDSGYSDMGKIVVEELEFQGLPTFLGPAGIFAGKISAGQNLVEYYPVEAASEIGDRHMYVVHGNQDKRVRLHHGEEMCEIALENGKEGNVECWFEDSVIRYDVGKGMDSDEHVSLMLTHTEDYDNRLVEFFTRSLM
jgi:hypothetical protein